MTRLLFLLLLFFTTNCSAQTNTHIEEHLKQMLDSLRHAESETFLIYSLKCVGGMRIDTCNYFDTEYLFWKQNKNTFLQKFNDCKFYKPVLLDSLNPLTFYLSHKDQIDRRN